MKKAVGVLLWCFLVVVYANADIVGTDSFDYADGAIAGKTGGYGWDFLGVGNGQGIAPTAWQNMADVTDVVGGALELSVDNPSDGWIACRREFGSDTWGTGAFQGTGIVYFAVTLTVNEAQGWIEFSAMDGTNDRIQYVMPWQSGGLGFFGLCNKNSGVKVYSTTTVELAKAYRIVAVLDYNGNSARMWINPDGSDYDTALGTTADVVLNDLGMWNWVNGVRLSSGGSTTWDDLIVATTFPETFIEGSLSDKPHNPDPAVGESDVSVNSTLSWAVPRDPNNPDAVNPNLTDMQLYMGTNADPNLILVADISTWDTETLRASYTPASALNYDTTYYWRVDSVLGDANDLEGNVWTFASEKSVPKITDQPAYQVVEAEQSAVFTVTASSISPITYQWYRYVDGVSDTQLSDEGDISGAQMASLTIANVELGDEGAYYCIVNNDSGTSVTSKTALLGVKRKIAYWDFEDNNPGSTIIGSPATTVYGDPVFTTGIIGSGMAFDNDSGAIDLLYTDPDNVAYFDICNYTMSTSFWVKTNAYTWWGPLVARNGEGSEGWQFRNRGDTNKICFTTRGTGNEDGTASDKTIYDGKWHFAVATYDGSVKKVYMDGVLSISDTASGLINPTPSPVSIAGRVKSDEGVLTYEAVTACTLDDVSIYNYALDAAKIAQIYADVTQTNVCPEQPTYDLNGDCIVDLNDFMLIAGQWLLDNTVYPTS